MAIVADRLALDLSALPWHAERFSAGFYLGRGNNRKPLLLVAPGLGNAVVPHVRYAASLVLTLAGGLVAKDLGQVLVTGDQARSARSTCSRPATTTCNWPNP